MTIKRFPKGVALVVGGSGGLGSVVCETLAANGSDIALTYRHNRQRAEEVAEKVRNLCLKRFGKPQEVADTVLYLSTAEYVTGQTIAVSGGYGI